MPAQSVEEYKIVKPAKKPTVKETLELEHAAKKIEKFKIEQRGSELRLEVTFDVQSLTQRQYDAIADPIAKYLDSKGLVAEKMGMTCTSEPGTILKFQNLELKDAIVTALTDLVESVNRSVQK